MSATTAAPAVDDVAAGPAAADAVDVDAFGAGPGLAGLLGTADHLVVGRLFLVSSLLLLVIGRVAGVLVDVERLDTATVGLLDEYVGSVFNASVTVDLFLFLLPAFLGLAIAIVPLQVGATTVAFPRAASAAFWIWLLSSGVLLASYVIEGGLQGFGTDADGIALWTVAFGGVLGGLLLATVCVLTTAVAMRAPGMTLDRVPAFTWSMFVTGTAWLLSLPVAAGALVLAYLDNEHELGAGWAAHLQWTWGSPQVLAFALPALGLLLDVVPVSARVRQPGRGVLLGALGAAAVLTFGADQLGVARDPGTLHDPLAIGAAFALVLVLLAVAGGVAAALRAGKPTLTSPLLFGAFAFLLLLAAAAVGAARSIEDAELVGTTADSAIRELAVVAGLLGVAGGAHHWATKLRGASLREPLARLAAVVLFLGGLLAAAPELVAGILDQPDGVRPLPTVRDGVEALNAVAAAGSVVVLLGVLLVVISLLAGNGSNGDEGEAAEVPADPWDGHTLEWATASPPVPGAVVDVDEVRSAEPLLDRKEAGVQEGSA